jgi:RNA polymerase sigma-70 factor (ECF subfamily)
MANESLSPESIFTSYAHQMFNVARTIVHNDMDADDVVQASMVKVIRNLASFRGESSLWTWVFCITRRTAIEHFRKRQVIQRREGEAICRENEPRDVQADSLIVAEDQEKVCGLLELLPKEKREAIQLLDYQEMTYVQVSRQLGLPVGTIKSRRSGAMRKLRSHLHLCTDGTCP